MKSMKEILEKIRNFFKSNPNEEKSAFSKKKIIIAIVTIVIIIVIILLLLLRFVKGVSLNQSSLELYYDGESATLTATVYSKGSVDQTVIWTSSDENVVIVTDGVVTPVKAGVATITATSKVNNKKYATCTVTVAKAENAITSFAIEGWTYGESASIPTALATYGTPTFYYATQESGPYTSEKPTDAGSYYVRAAVEADENYEGATKDLQFVISKADYDMSSATWNYTQAFTYTGSEKKVEVTGLPEGVTANYTDNAKTNAGSYTASATFSYDSANYNEPSIADCAWTINKADATITTTGVIKEYTYTGSEQIVNSGATVDSGATLIYSNNKFTNVPSSGKQIVTISADETDNYNAASTTVEITINKATGMISTPTAKTGLIYAEDSAQILINEGSKGYGEWLYKLGSDEYSTTIPTATNAGTYTVYYKFIGGANHNDIAETSINVTIAKQSIAKPNASINSSSFYDGREKTCILTTNDNYTISNNTRTNAGSQTVTVSLNDKENYQWADGTIEDLSYTLTIMKANQSVLISTIAKTYDKTPVSPTYSRIGDGTVTLEYKMQSEDDSAYTTTAPTDAGNYTLRISVSETDNYFSTSSTRNFTINKADATIKVSGVTTVYTYTGSEQMVNSGATLNHTETTLSYTNNKFTDVGTGSYTVTISAAETKNYKAASTTVTITVNKASQTVPAVPTADSTTPYPSATSINLAAITTTGYGDVKYAKSTTNSAPTDGWQDSVEFTDLAVNTTYYFFAKYDGDGNHTAATSSGTAITTPNYLTFTANTANSSVTPKFKTGEYQYSTDNGKSWTKGEIDGTTTITLEKTGDTVMMKGTGCTTDSGGFGSTPNYFSMEGSIAASGSVTSLTDELGNNPNVTLTTKCYNGMFVNCTALTTAPELPALTLTVDCYGAMFKGCTSLTVAPELPATTLAAGCYKYMFANCSSLTTATLLPVTSFENADVACYGMFEGCTSLKIATSGSESNKIFTCPDTSVSYNPAMSMFSNTAGSFTGSPTTGTTYYWYTD